MFHPSYMLLVVFLLSGVRLGQSQDKDFSVLHRHSLQDYSLAKCTDGSPAAYYADRVVVTPGTKVLIYLGESMDKTSGFGGSCTYIEDCHKTCLVQPTRCHSPLELTRIQSGGIWSRDEANNPFANYFKVYVPSCSLDEFSGTRGPLDENGENRLVSGSIYFHGRHIFNALLRDLVAKHGLDRAESLVLVGSGSSARGVARTCDFLKEAMATVNQLTTVRCVLDGPTDFVPFWIQDDEKTMDRCLKNRQALTLKDEETRRFLWGRADDESCIKDLQDTTNSSALAQLCGIFSRSFRHISTPLFVISSQLDQNPFNELTCGVTRQDPEFVIYESAWRRGMLQLAETLNTEKPENGWFIPNCDASDDKSGNSAIMLDEASSAKRQLTRVPLFSSGQDKNVLQVLNNWLQKGASNDDHLAIDPLGILNPSCSLNKNGKLKSLNLDLRPDLLRRKGLDLLKAAPVVQVIARKQPSLPLDARLRGRFPTLPTPSLGDDDLLGSLPFLDSTDLTDENESAAAAAGAAAAVAALAAEKEVNYRKYSQAVKDPFLSSNRFLPPLDYNPKISDLNPSLDSFDYDFGDASFSVNANTAGNSNSDDDFDLSAFLPTTDVNLAPDTTKNVLSEQVVPLQHSRSRRARLWRRLYYMQYLRELYKRTYRDYYLDYYYGRNSGQFGRLVKKEEGDSGADEDKPSKTDE